MVVVFHDDGDNNDGAVSVLKHWACFPLSSFFTPKILHSAEWVILDAQYIPHPGDLSSNISLVQDGLSNKSRAEETLSVGN